MRYLKLLFAFFLLIFISACGGQDKDGVDKVRVMLSWTPGPENAFMFYGIEQNVFKENDIEVEWSPSKGSSVVTTALANGGMDFGFISSDYLLVARAKGFPLKAVLTLYHESPVVIYSIKDKGIDTPQKLVGKRLGVLSKSASYPQVINFLKEQGINEGDYKEVFSRGIAQELLQDKVDAMMQYVNYGPAQFMVNSKLPINMIRLRDYGVDMYGTSICVNEKLLQEKPDLVKRFVFSLLKSLEISKANHEQVLMSLLNEDDLLDSLEMDKGLRLTEDMIYGLHVDSLGLGYMEYDGWERTLNEINSSAEKPYKVNIGEVFDDRFLKEYKTK